jgi:hypothetical protein
MCQDDLDWCKLHRIDDFVWVSKINFHKTVFFIVHWFESMVTLPGIILGSFELSLGSIKEDRYWVGTDSVLCTVMGQVNYWNFDMCWPWKLLLLCSVIWNQVRMVQWKADGRQTTHILSPGATWNTSDFSPSGIHSSKRKLSESIHYF